MEIVIIYRFNLWYGITVPFEAKVSISIGTITDVGMRISRFSPQSVLRNGWIIFIRKKKKSCPLGDGRQVFYLQLRDCIRIRQH